ncbi:signal recognition particle-docking protein FtsY [Candidatus Dependentiae bacterium]|nr:signal recognition particle-docking protein FtsY [Candidatus Dependentiae bacterium]
MLNFFKTQLNKIVSHFSRISSLFSKTSIDEASLKELEQLLIQADTGVKTTRHILDQLKKTAPQELSGAELKRHLSGILLDLLKPFTAAESKVVYLMVGVNGSGKTTFAGKLANHFVQAGKKTILVAADTFRAAAPEQLRIWAEKSGARIVQGAVAQDPASVVFSGCEIFKKEHADALIIDTAGRLQTKTNLMNELSKIKRIIARQLPDYKIITLLTIDSMLGQNSFEQAKIFHDATPIDGIVLTKLDGTGKGGIVFAINYDLGIPVAYISFGEKIDDLKLFDKNEYVSSLFT